MKNFNIGYTFFNTTKRLFSAKIMINYWEPFPNRLLGLRNTPFLAHISGGYTGHISMEIQYSNGEKFYLSVWPKEIREEVPGECCPTIITPIINSNSLQDDVYAENNRHPQTKIIEIDADTEKKIHEYIEKNIKIELKKDFRDRQQWSLTNNCATFVSNLLYSCGIILTKQLFISTPHYVFQMVDELEKDIYLKKMEEPSYQS